MTRRPVTPTPPIPEDGRSLDLDWVRRALAAGGRLALPTGIRIEEVGVGSGVMGQVMRCHLDYGESNDSAPASIIVKLPSVNAKTRRLGKRLLLYRREYDFYRNLASRIPVSTPRLLYGDFEPKSHRFALVLEDIRGMAVVDQIAGASPAQAKRAIRALARMHGAYWNRTQEAPVSGSYDSNNPKLSPIVQVVYLANLVRTLKHFGDAFSSTTRPLAQAFGLGVVDHMAALGAGPRTFTHGDYRLDNLFFDDGGDDGVTVIVCGGLDLDDDRSRRLAEVGLKRSLAAIEDLDVAEFIPASSRPSRNRRLFTHACRIAYGAYRSFKGI
ncbi:MAG: phosphotransferase [Gammaproteobacteria bacterium]|nr:phosphotransferase [Gammaproteobacteria bacterium]